MDRTKVFISYQSKDKDYALRLQKYLIEYCGFSVEIAPDNIKGGSISIEEILTLLTKCNLFIPLISKNLKISFFANQEIGVAVAFKKKVIPIKLDRVNPYGMINKYHGILLEVRAPRKYHSDLDNLWELAVTIGKICLEYKPSTPIYKKTHYSLVYAFQHSPSFDTSNVIIQTLLQLNDLNTDDLNLIKKAVQSNPQIDRGEHYAFGLPNLKRFLNTKYEFNID